MVRGKPNSVRDTYVLQRQSGSAAEEQFHSLTGSHEEDDGPQPSDAEVAMRKGMHAAQVMELLCCILMTIVFQRSPITIGIWALWASALFVRICLWGLKTMGYGTFGYRWGHRLLLPSYLTPCALYSLLVDQVLIHTCQVEIAFMNVSAWDKSAVGFYPRCYLECKDLRNGTMADILLHELNRTHEEEQRYAGGMESLICVYALQSLSLLFQYGIPVLFGYIFVKGILAKALKVNCHTGSILHNIRLFVLDTWDIAGFATITFDPSAHIWFAGHKKYSWIKLGVLCVAGIAGFLEVLLGLLLKAETNAKDAGKTAPGLKKGVHVEASDDEEKAADSAESITQRLESPLFVTFISFFFIDLPLGAFRVYLLLCGVQLSKMYLAKNVICAIYELARACQCNAIQRMVESGLAGLPGVEEVDIEALKYQNFERKQMLKDIVHDTYLTPGMRVTVKKTFTADSESGSLTLRKGAQGTVVRTDDNGDALVKFDGIKSKQWIFRHNFLNLNRFYEQSTLDES